MLPLWILAAAVVRAQVFSVKPTYDNVLRPGVAQANASATLASGSSYPTNGRPVESGAGRFQLASWTAGMPVYSAIPDFAFGDVIVSPPRVDLTRVPTVTPTNAAFYMASRRQLVAAQAGACRVTWPLEDGTVRTVTYTIGAIPTQTASRLFWTDELSPGAVNTNLNALPDNAEYTVSLNRLHAKLHYNDTVPDFSPTNSQVTGAGQSARSALAGSNLGLPAVWIDDNGLLRARAQSGFVILEYFDTPTFDNSVGYEVVSVGPARVYRSNLVLGQRLLPTEGAEVADELIASITKASDYVVQWTADGSHFQNQIFATAVNSDPTQPLGDASRTQILWQRTGILDVLWPYEAHWYAITWPGDQVANHFIFDPSNPAASPTVSVPTNHTVRVVWSENPGGVIKSDSPTAPLVAVGEGRALLQYQNSRDVWFLPVRVLARTNGAYISNQEVYWPMTKPLQPVTNTPLLQFDGSGTHLSQATVLDPEFTLEFWVKPNSLTNSQALMSFLDYPQQANARLALSIQTNLLRLDVRGTNDSTIWTLSGRTNLIANKWNHIALKRERPGLFFLFLNGAPEAAEPFPGVEPGATNGPLTVQWTIGKDWQGEPTRVPAQAPFSGEFKEIRLWNRALTGQEIRAGQARSLTGAEPNLVHLIRPEWQESGTPYEETDGVQFQVLDSATGGFVPGYGTPSTTGTVPHPLEQRLAFSGTNHRLEVPFEWRRSQNLTVEFWFFTGGGSGPLRVLQAANESGPATAWIEWSGGACSLVSAGVTNSGTRSLGHDTWHHMAFTWGTNVLSLYVDGVLDATAALPNVTVLGSRFVLGLATSNTSAAVEYEDLRIYRARRAAEMIVADRFQSVALSDPDLAHSFRFDRVLPIGTATTGQMIIPDQARGGIAFYRGDALLGSSVSSVPAEEVTGGIIRSGTAYHPGVYRDQGRILPVNDLETNRVMEVWWPTAVSGPFMDQPLRFPGLVTRYRLMDPLGAPELAIAGQDSEGFTIPADWDRPSLYHQNDPAAPGYNPNDEHGLIVGSSAYALRWDFNGPATSPGFLLLEYGDREKGGWTYLQPIRVVSTNVVHPTFDRSLIVGNLLQAPKPMLDLPPSVLSGPLPGEDPRQRLYQDRRYYWWARSAAAPVPDIVPARWFYPLQDGFFWPASLGTRASGSPVPFGNTSNGMAIRYTVQWPTNVPTLALGQTLSDPMPSGSGIGYLPAVTGQASVEVLHDDAAADSKVSARLMDPSTPTTARLDSLAGVNTATDVRLGKTYFTLLPPHLRDRVSWDPLAKLLKLRGSIVRPVTDFPYVLPAWLGSSSDPNSDFSILLGLSSEPAWVTAVGQLRQSANLIPNAEVPFDSLVLVPTGLAGGYVTLGFNTRTNLNLTGDPVSVVPIRVDPTRLFAGRIVVVYSANKFDQYTTLRHSGDFGGDPSLYEFDWRYSPPSNGQAPPDPETRPTGWTSFVPVRSGLNRVVFGGPGLLTLKDEYFSCRWRCLAAGAPNTNWSAWTAPALVENWLSRALDGINPYEQRLESLANNHLDLRTSILSQAGKRFVGDVPLNMENADKYGLIEIYETLLEQARNLSIDAGYRDDDVNASLLDAASKLNELYTMLGDEALADAKDPTVAWGSRELGGEAFGARASGLFAFQGIVPNLLEEELALLRGLDDTTSTPVTTHPVYNRLYWNFTKGVNGGEPAYALNYGIPSLSGDPNGSITEADAAQLYPQGHGDAYGHYLTALSEYFRLLTNTNFTWIPRAEVKSIGGVNVTFDYVDERKMASSALQLARTSLEVMDRTFRRDYDPGDEDRRALFADSNQERAGSATEWGQRSSQGILYQWMVLNSLLPEGEPGDSSQVVSRLTVPEIGQLADLMGTIQDKQDEIDRGDSPMGVAANVVPFDVDPQRVDAGESHFEQVYARAVAALRSADAVLRRAEESASNLRRQDVSLEAFRLQVERREAEFNAQLIDLYGTPYRDDVGPTGIYATGYEGPDLYHFNYLDRDLFNPADAGAVTNVSFYARYQVTGASLDTLAAVGTNVTYSVNSDGIPVLPAGWSGQRASYGKIQGALGDYVRAWISLRAAVSHMDDRKNQLEARLQRLRDHNAYSDQFGAIGDALAQRKLVVDLLQQGVDAVLATLDLADAEIQSAYEASKDPLPESFIAGLADGGDLSFPARIGLSISKLIGEESIGAAKDAANFASFAAGKASEQLDSQIEDNDAAFADAEEQAQTVMETSMLLSRLNADSDSVYGAAVALRQAWQAYLSLVAKGNQMQADVVAFRQGNASRIQEARYADVIFRTFRNEDLVEYLGAFEQASRYVYAAARVYDYETGLLDPEVVSGQEGDFLGATLRATQLGDLVDGRPVPGSSEAGTLSSILARMSANWAVLKGRFGINNPTREAHRISLRQELFRIGRSTNAVDEAGNVSAWRNALHTFRIADIRQVPEFRNFCQAYSPMGTNEPALVIPFSTEITAGRNLFGFALAGGDTVFDSAHFTTKVRGAAVSFEGFREELGQVLTRSPRVYLVPVGVDRQRTPMSGGTSVRDWRVVDQVWPIPFPTTSGSVNLPLAGVGTENVHAIRRHAPMLAFDSDELPATARVPYDTRLIGRSAWNTQWVLIIPGSALSASPSDALDELIEGVSDIHLHLDTYSYSGN